MNGLTLNATAWGIAPDHLAGLDALILSPVVVWLLLRTIRVAARLNLPPATHFHRRYSASLLPTRVAAWLMLTSGLVHLAILPHHLAEEPGTALLFGLDAFLFALLAAGIVFRRRWRIAAALLLAANVVFYLGYLAGRREEVDQLGVVTKVVEFTALGLLLLPHRPTFRSHGRKLRWVAATAAFVLSTTLAGAFAWAIAARDAGTASAETAMSTDRAHHHHGATGVTGMVELADPDEPPTPAERAAAAKLAADTAAGIAKYADVDVALADGYRPFGPATGTMVHYTNHRYEKDGRVLDPSHPETLVYAGTPDGPLLLGAMYALPDLDRSPPDVGGPLTVWHVHANVCLGPLPPFLVGVLTPFGTCPFGSFNIVTGAMIHVWTIPWSGGPYGEMTDNDVKRIVAGEDL
ncbi:MAG TPA: hypothetical protein VH482_04775 [Thermomicrobiales bacterium]|jgi:hypothetical protein